MLTLPEDDPRRIFQGAAIIRRMARLGLVSEEEMKLDMILELSTSKLMDRRLQTRVFKLGLAKSIHHARVLIKQRHIRVGQQVVNAPSFMVHVDSEKHIQFAENSPYGGGRPVRWFMWGNLMDRDVWPESTTRTIRRRLRNKSLCDNLHSDVLFVSNTPIE